MGLFNYLFGKGKPKPTGPVFLNNGTTDGQPGQKALVFDDLELPMQMGEAMEAAEQGPKRPLLYMFQHVALREAAFENHPELVSELAGECSPPPLLHFRSRAEIRCIRASVTAPNARRSSAVSSDRTSPAATAAVASGGRLSMPRPSTASKPHRRHASASTWSRIPLTLYSACHARPRARNPTPVSVAHRLSDEYSPTNEGRSPLPAARTYRTPHVAFGTSILSVAECKTLSRAGRVDQCTACS